MATVIRFARHGTKKKPFFRLVVQDQHSPRDGRFIEHIGHFNPLKGDTSLLVERDRLEYWLSTGAQMSDSVRNRVAPKMKEWSSASPSVSVESPATPKSPKAKATKRKET